MTSATAWTLAPSRVMRRAIIRPMSPLPRITTSRPGISPSMFTSRWAVPAVVNARRAVAGDVQRAPGPLPAAHGQNHRIGADLT